MNICRHGLSSVVATVARIPLLRVIRREVGLWGLGLARCALLLRRLLLLLLLRRRRLLRVATWRRLLIATLVGVRIIGGEVTALLRVVGSSVGIVIGRVARRHHRIGSIGSTVTAIRRILIHVLRSTLVALALLVAIVATIVLLLRLLATRRPRLLGGTLIASLLAVSLPLIFLSPLRSIVLLLLFIIREVDLAIVVIGVEWLLRSEQQLVGMEVPLLINQKVDLGADPGKEQSINVIGDKMRYSTNGESAVHDIVDFRKWRELGLGDVLNGSSGGSWDRWRRVLSGH